MFAFDWFRINNKYDFRLVNRFAQREFFKFFKAKDTVLSPINGHSKKQTPLISGQIYFPWRNYGQTLIKNFLKSGQAISGPSV